MARHHRNHCNSFSPFSPLLSLLSSLFSEFFSQHSTDSFVILNSQNKEQLRLLHLRAKEKEGERRREEGRGRERERERERERKGERVRRDSTVVFTNPLMASRPASFLAQVNRGEKAERERERERLVHFHPLLSPTSKHHFKDREKEKERGGRRDSTVVVFNPILALSPSVSPTSPIGERDRAAEREREVEVKVFNPLYRRAVTFTKGEKGMGSPKLNYGSPKRDNEREEEETLRRGAVSSPRGEKMGVAGLGSPWGEREKDEEQVRVLNPMYKRIHPFAVGAERGGEDDDKKSVTEGKKEREKGEEEEVVVVNPLFMRDTNILRKPRVERQPVRPSLSHTFVLTSPRESEPSSPFLFPPPSPPSSPPSPRFTRSFSVSNYKKIEKGGEKERKDDRKKERKDEKDKKKEKEKEKEKKKEKVKEKKKE